MARRKTYQDRPFVSINMAMTADGKIATANRAVSSFGSKRDHDHLLELRATVDAVMSGARTVDQAPVDLGPGPKHFRQRRLRNDLSEYNLRVVASGSASLNPEAEIFQHSFSPILLLANESAPKRKLSKLSQRVTATHLSAKKGINFTKAMRWLRREWKVKRLLCEGGGALNDAMFRAGLVDEVHLTVCPLVFGGANAPTIADGAGFAKLLNAAQFELVGKRHVQLETYLTYRAVEKQREL